MANKRPKPEEIVMKLRQVEVLTGQGMPRLDVSFGPSAVVSKRLTPSVLGMPKELTRLLCEPEI